MLKVEVASVEATLVRNARGAGGSGDPISVSRQVAEEAETRAFNEAIRASLAAELGHVSRQASFNHRD
eukprot:1634082-Prymnesium_polylepis.2